MQIFSKILACIFGYSMLAYSVIVTVETIGRKFFDFSLQGTDELGGYVFAIGSSIGFSLALIEQAHIRIDLFHNLLPRVVRSLLNWLSAVLMAILALGLVMICAAVLFDTWAYNSVAPSPWATPLIYPQVLWYGFLLIFAALGTGFATLATISLMRGRLDEIDRRYGPLQLEEEVQSELADLRTGRAKNIGDQI